MKRTQGTVQAAGKSASSQSDSASIDENVAGDHVNVLGSRNKGTVIEEMNKFKKISHRQGSGGVTGVKERGMYREKQQEPGRPICLMKR